MQHELTLNLTLKGKWFDMTLSGVKKEEYREIKPYWSNRLLLSHQSEDGNFEPHLVEFKTFTHIKSTNGYGNHRPSLTIECKGIRIGRGNPEWGAPTDKDVFILSLGDITNTQNIK